MEFKDLVGRTIDETALFNEVQFEIECDREKYLGQSYTVFFERIKGQTVRVTEVVHYLDPEQLHVVNKASFGKREWLNIEGFVTRVSIQLCRLNQSGRLANVRENITNVQETGFGYVEENRKPITPEEHREGFIELAKIMGYQIDLEKLRTKKAV